MNKFPQTLFFLCLLTIVFPFGFQPAMGGETISAAKEMDYRILAGKWQRVDGNYILTVGDVLKEGPVTVKYFNPRPIHVDTASVSTENGFMKLFIQLQDKYYEGSTYTLVYYSPKDLLLGYYYQAPMDKTYEVMFERQN